MELPCRPVHTHQQATWRKRRRLPSSIVLATLLPNGTFLAIAIVIAFITAIDCTNIRLRDNTPKGTVIMDRVLPNVRGTHLMYSLLQTTASRYFILNNRTGQLHSLRTIDRDRLCVESGLCCTNDVTTELVDSRILSSNACPSLPYGRRVSGCFFNISVSVVSAQGQQPDIHEVTVMVCEENDHAPVFVPPPSQSLSPGIWQDVQNEDGLSTRPPLYMINVSESVPVGHKVPMPLATDIDAPPFHVKHYELIQSDSNNPQSARLRNQLFRLEPVWNNGHSGSAHQDPNMYSIHESTGTIVGLDLVLLEPLDRESASEHNYRLLAVDGGSPPRTGTLLLKIRVQDANDHAPTFTQAVYETTVEEGVSPGNEILQVHAVDADEGPNAHIVYEISPSITDWNVVDVEFSAMNRSGGSGRNPVEVALGGDVSSEQDLPSSTPSYWFRLDSETGKIYLKRPLDYEVRRRHRFRVLAYNPVTHQAGVAAAVDSGYRSRTATTTVVVNVGNLDDEPPSIVVDYATGGQNDYKEIRENGPPHYFVAFITASDPDLAEPGGTVAGPWTDSLVVTCQLDSHQDVYRLDRDRSSQMGTATSVRYSLVTRSPLDRERSAEDHVQVTCQDAGIPSKKATAVIKVIILDENDCDPEIRVLSIPPGSGGRMSPTEAWTLHKLVEATGRQPDAIPLVAAYLGGVPVYTVHLLENQPIGTVFARVRAVDNDSGANGYVTFELPKSPALLNVSATQGTAGLSKRERIELSSSPETFEYIHIDEVKGDLSTKRKLDREEGGYSIFDQFFAVVKATDHGATIQRSAYVLLVVVVLDENDNPPTFMEPKMHFTIQENEPAPAVVGEIRVVDADLHPVGPFIHGGPSLYAQAGHHGGTTQLTGRHRLNLRIDHGHIRRDLPFVLYQTSEGRFFLNTTRALDRESEEAFQFVLIASDTESTHLRGGSTQSSNGMLSSRGHTSTASVLVTVLDVNDNQPEIIFPNPTTSNSTLHRVSYMEYAGYEVISINANDRDAGDLNGKFYFELIPDLKGTDLFTIDRTKGLIRTRRRLTKEDLGEHRLQVVVSDHGTPPLRTHLMLRLLVDQSEPHHLGDVRAPSGGYYQPRPPQNGPLGSEQYDRQSLLHAYQRDHDPNNIKRTIHADILLIVIVAMILILLVVMFGLCFYLRYKRNLFGFLPNLCVICLGDRSSNSSMEQSFRQKSQTCLKNNLDPEKRRLNTINHSQSGYPGVTDSLLDCINGSHQPMRLDSIGMSCAPSPRSPLALNSHQQSTQFIGPHSANTPLGAAYSTRERILLDENRPNLLGSAGFFATNMPIYRPNTSMAINVPDVADQAETLLHHKHHLGNYRMDQNCQVADGFYAGASVPFNMYNLGRNALNPAIQQEPFGPDSSFAPCPELDFRPIPDDFHLYQHIESNQLGTLRGGRASNTSGPKLNYYQKDARNAETQSSLFAWRSDPSLNQGADGWGTLNGSVFEQTTTDTSKSTERHRRKSLQRSNSNKYGGRVINGSKTIGAYYSPLDEPTTVVTTAKQKADIDKQPTTGVGSRVICSEHYTVTFPKVQASFV
ncbi:unnamed protein product [Dicrocoelium dendriticum]|nr:unnamed protein product [Dicrocoelium dendriticum]